MLFAFNDGALCVWLVAVILHDGLYTQQAKFAQAQVSVIKMRLIMEAPAK
jgi:hypothetical protein